MLSPAPSTRRSSVLRLELLILALSLLAFGFYAVAWPQAPVLEGDSPQYMAVARDLQDFVLDSVHDRSPGYPMLLRITGAAHEPTRTLFFTSVFLHLLSIWILAGVLKVLGASDRTIVVFVFVLLLPPFVEPAGLVMTENLAQFSVAAGLGALLAWLNRPRWWLLTVAGIALGFSGVTRPVYQLVSVALAAVLLGLARLVPRRWHGRAIVPAVLGVPAIALAIVGALAWWNQSQFGFFAVVPTTGLHLSTKTMPLLERLPDEYEVAREILIRERNRQLVQRGGTHTGTQAIWSARDELARVLGMDTPALSRYLLRMNLVLIRTAPLEYLQEVAKSMAVYWFPPAGALASFDSTLLRWVWAALHASFVVLLLLQVCTVAGLLVVRQTGVPVPDVSTPMQTAAWLTAGTIVLYTMLLSCFLDIGEVRQRRPTDVLVVFMVFTGFTVWARAFGVSPGVRPWSASNGKERG